MVNRVLLFKQLRRVALHIVFWGATLLFFTYFFGFQRDDFKSVLSFSLFLMPVTIATTYVSIYKLIPDYLLDKRYYLFGLYSLYTIIISIYFIIMSVFLGLVYFSGYKFNGVLSISRNWLFVIIAVYLVVVMVSAFKLLKLNLYQAEKTKELETEILESQLKLKEQELNYLKMQIHPHFLFNTLNTMYGLALKKADEAPKMILKLSSLLDYLLYQTDKPFVSLSEEVDHIKDYIELEKMRFKDTLHIIFDHDHISEEAKIAPMLLLPFIENSFKHGGLNEGALLINIELICGDDSIEFSVENTVSKSMKDRHGLGLANLQKRLDILYKDNYDLRIDGSENAYKINLKLNLD